MSRDATTDEIRSAYRREAMKWHPDRNKDPNAPRMMRFINEAWEVLGNTERRRQYDQRSAEGTRSDQYQDPVKEFRESILPWLLESAIDLYDVLDVSTNATLDEIDRALIYIRQRIEGDQSLAGDPAASAFLRLVNIAHFVLSNPEYRAEYDRHYFLMRSQMAEQARRQQEEQRREFEQQERERQQEQERREAEKREREARERRVREEHERREREKQRLEELRAREEAQRRWHERRQAEERQRRESEENANAVQAKDVALLNSVNAYARNARRENGEYARNTKNGN